MIIPLFAILTGSAIIGLYLCITEKKITQKLVGLNIFSAKIIAIIILIANQLKIIYYLDVAILYSILGFLGIIVIARYLEKDSL